MRLLSMILCYIIKKDKIQIFHEKSGDHVKMSQIVYLSNRLDCLFFCMVFRAFFMILTNYLLSI